MFSAADRDGLPDGVGLDGPGCVRYPRTAPNIELIVDVAVQFFQSVIAIELAVAGVLLWQIRFFELSGVPSM
jgi:hypothetical protein